LRLYREVPKKNLFAGGKKPLGEIWGVGTPPGKKTPVSGFPGVYIVESRFYNY